MRLASRFCWEQADVVSSRVVTKPATGLFDLANNVTEGIRNTTTVFDQTSIDRVRLPRFTASDGILRVRPPTLSTLADPPSPTKSEKR